MKILIINGSNLNVILSRDREYYGDMNLKSIESLIKSKFPEITSTFITTNSENEIIKQLQDADKNFDGLIINPGAFTHISIGIRDALELCKIPKVEVHLSNLSTRENFRNQLITTAKCNGYISGFKHISYLSAVFALKELIEG